MENISAEILSDIHCLIQKLHPVKNSILNTGEFGVLRCIVTFQSDDGSKATASQISAIMGLSQPTITPMINRLEEKGFITKTTCDTDRRIRYLSSTKEGQQLHDTMAQRKKEFWQEFIAYLGEEDTLALHQIISKANDFVDISIKNKTKED